MKIYTSDTDEKEKLKIGKCNEEWVSIIIASPSITYDVDYSKKDVFSATFCFIAGGYSIPANMIVQQIRRVRHLIDGKIFICDESHSYWEKNTLKNIDDQIIQRFNRFPQKVSKSVSEFNSQPNNEIDMFDEKKSPELYQKNVNFVSKFGTDTKEKDLETKRKIELESMTIKSCLGSNGQPTLKKSWFTQIYRFYCRSELESQQNITNWIRGYLCQQGFKYYVISSGQKQDKELHDSIEQEIVTSKKARLKTQTQKYLKAPILKDSRNKLSQTKYYHCRLFGLKKINKQFYQEWIDTQNYYQMSNLVHYLTSSSQQQRNQIEYNQSDYLLTEKNINACRLVDQLLEVCGLDLKGHFFTGMSTTQTEIIGLLPHQLFFLKQNRRDLLTYFGPVGRIQGQMETTYHLNKLVSRILSSFFGIEWKCQQTQTKKNGKKKHNAVYSLEIPDEIYELLSYRVLSYRQEKLQWMFPLVVCGQLKNKYRQIGKTWTQLAICTEWPECPEIEMVLKKEPKIKLKLKPVSIDSIRYEEDSQPLVPAEEFDDCEDLKGSCHL